MNSKTFNTFCKAVHKAKKVNAFHGTLLALDPGETTGWCVFEYLAANDSYVKVASGQLKTWPMQDFVNNFKQLLAMYKPTAIVHELYAVYEWKATDHSWSSVPTLRVIGGIEVFAIMADIPVYTQTAQIAKNFCTDDKLKTWGFYITGEKHARDAFRHAAYFLLFGPKD